MVWNRCGPCSVNSHPFSFTIFSWRQIFLSIISLQGTRIQNHMILSAILNPGPSLAALGWALGRVKHRNGTNLPELTGTSGNKRSVPRGVWEQERSRNGIFCFACAVNEARKTFIAPAQKRLLRGLGTNRSGGPCFILLFKTVDKSDSNLNHFLVCLKTSLRYVWSWIRVQVSSTEFQEKRNFLINLVQFQSESSCKTFGMKMSLRLGLHQRK